jgi:hypothetical protein
MLTCRRTSGSRGPAELPHPCSPRCSSMIGSVNYTNAAGSGLARRRSSQAASTATDELRVELHVLCKPASR